MCGIGGLARFGGSQLGREADQLLGDLVRSLAHRGPDEHRLLRDGNVGLAFTRLSLVAPEDGSQPLVSRDGSVVLIANGEVYNHRDLAAGLGSDAEFTTKSDCEVLLHLYQRDGLRFLDKVNGMFAFVLWDRRRDVLLLCRDRFGIKPLFYHHNDARIVFASEIKALFADPATPRRLDWDRALANPNLTAAPAFTHVEPISWFEDIHLAPAACIVEISLWDGATTTHKYWSLPEPYGESDASNEEYVGCYRNLLQESVSDCVMADAEIGLFLSGGIDSAAVAALASAPELHTFTAVMGGTVLNGDAAWGHRTARLLGLPNHQVLFDNRRDVTAEEWRRLLWLSETPQCGPESFYKYEMHRFVRATRPDIKGMLLGAASDEFNGGYSVGYAEGGDWDVFLRNIAGMGRAEAFGRRPELAPWWQVCEEPLLTDEALGAASGVDLVDPYHAYLAWNWRNVQQYNVWHEDRSAAGNGIEARVPFLDHRLVELAAAIPPSRRPALLWDKQILRRAMHGVLPDEFLNREKVAFYHGEGLRHTYPPFIRMLARDGDALLEEALSTTRAKEYLNADGLRFLLRSVESDPGSTNVEILLRLVNLGLLERMTQDLPGPHVDGPFAPIRESLQIDDWHAQADSIADVTLFPTVVHGADVYSLADNVDLAHVAAKPDSWFVVVDGAFEFVLDEQQDGPWLNVLRSFNGTRSLDDLVTSAGTSMEAVLPLVRESLEAGLLVTHEAAHAGGRA